MADKKKLIKISIILLVFIGLIIGALAGVRYYLTSKAIEEIGKAVKNNLGGHLTRFGGGINYGDIKSADLLGKKYEITGISVNLPQGSILNVGTATVTAASYTERDYKLSIPGSLSLMIPPPPALTPPAGAATPPPMPQNLEISFGQPFDLNTKTDDSSSRTTMTFPGMVGIKAAGAEVLKLVFGAGSTISYTSRGEQITADANANNLIIEYPAVGMGVKIASVTSAGEQSNDPAKPGVIISKNNAKIDGISLILPPAAPIPQKKELEAFLQSKPMALEFTGSTNINVSDPGRPLPEHFEFAPFKASLGQYFISSTGKVDMDVKDAANPKISGNIELLLNNYLPLVGELQTAGLIQQESATQATSFITTLQSTCPKDKDGNHIVSIALKDNTATINGLQPDAFFAKLSGGHQSGENTPPVAAPQAHESEQPQTSSPAPVQQPPSAAGQPAPAATPSPFVQPSQ